MSGLNKEDESAPLLGEGSTENNRAQQPSPEREFPDQEGFGIHEIMYSANSFCAVLKPVSLTMLLASLAVVALQEETEEESLDAYTVYNVGDESGDTNTVKLGKSIVNALIIVCVLAAATFGIVCLYKYRCMKLLIGYMMLSSMMLLGLMGSLMLWTALELWQVPCDAITFYFIAYNFAVVGVISIFWKKGIPMQITQFYLVCTSVLMAWQLSHFEEWTGWCLLVALALYDLCAVLTPCGPLKALVTLMQEYNEPMPGLLYEAELPSEDNGTPTVIPPATSLNQSASSAQEMRSLGQQQRQDTAVVQGAGVENGTAPTSVHTPTEETEIQAFGEADRSIKLGLGDFVFYSVLVSKAALYDFATCAICFLVILSGLGATLVLLSVFQKALPALPISIGLGVSFFFLTRFLIVPFIEALAGTPIYV